MAQFSVDHLELFDQLKTGTTYVIIRDTNNIQAQQFMTIYRNYWNFNQIKFIPFKEVINHVSENCMFISINSLFVSSKSNTSTYIYLSLWTFDEKLIQSKITNIDIEKQIELGRIDLYTDFQTLDSPSKISNYKYSGNNHFRNWGLGYLKNYLQEFQRLIANGVHVRLSKSKSNKAQLNILKSQTLYVPEYIFTKFDEYTGNEDDFVDEYWLFKNYGKSYKVLTSIDLNHKILSDRIPFYYLQYVKSSTNKYVYIVNSKTGEVIYHNFSKHSYNIHQNDIDKIERKVNIL